jgi:hypothetical protein
VILIGEHPKTLIMVARKPHSKWWQVVCFGAKRHYRKDGTCKHTDEVLAMTKPEIKDRVRVQPFGGKERATAKG